MDFSENGLIASLSRADQAAVRAASRSTVLRANEVLTSPASPSNTIYFLTGAVVAQLMNSAAIEPVAVGLVGFSGVVGLHLAVGGGTGSFTSLVQGQGPAWAIEGKALKKLAGTRAPILGAIARHLCRESEERASYAEELQRLSVTQRLARWIARSKAPMLDGPLSLTHIHLASMLGVRRASISMAAVELRDLGLVDYVRGKISVLDQAGLENLSFADRRLSSGM